MRKGLGFTRSGALLVALAMTVPIGAVHAQTCEELSTQCTTTPLSQCVDAVGNSVTVQIGGLGAKDSDANGGTCAGDPVIGLITFTKTAADELKVTLENTPCDDTSSITAFFFNTTTSVGSLVKDSPFTDPDPTLTPWDLGYSQTMATNDGFGFRADGFGNFDAAIYNGDSSSPNGGNPNELRDGNSIDYFVSVPGGYDLCDFLAEISEPPPGDRNRSTVGRFQSCGTQGNSAYIGPCTPEGDLLAVVSSFVLTPGDGRMTVAWETSLEIENAGFNVLRKERGGSWTVVNPTFIPGAGDSVSGASYRFEDPTALNGVEYLYRVEDIDFRGVKDLSDIRNGVPNPQNPDVRLEGPAYGSAVSLERGLTFRFTSDGPMRGNGLLQVSADPTFEGSVLSLPVTLRGGSREATPNPRMLSDLQDAAVDGVLFWRIADRRGRSVSDTFLMEIR